jgi:hypothetical protein
MATSELDAHARIKRISEIEAELTALDHRHESRTEMVKQWERLLAELADLQDTVGNK